MSVIHGIPVDQYELNDTARVQRIRSQARARSEARAELIARRINGEPEEAAMTVLKRLRDDEDICIAEWCQCRGQTSPRSLPRKKCCRYTVKRRYWLTYKPRIDGVHFDMFRLSCENDKGECVLKKADFKPEFLESMHLIIALNLAESIRSTSSFSYEMIEVMGKALARFRW